MRRREGKGREREVGKGMGERVFFFSLLITCYFCFFGIFSFLGLICSLITLITQSYYSKKFFGKNWSPGGVSIKTREPKKGICVSLSPGVERKMTRDIIKALRFFVALIKLALKKNYY